MGRDVKTTQRMNGPFGGCIALREKAPVKPTSTADPEFMDTTTETQTCTSTKGQPMDPKQTPSWVKRPYKHGNKIYYRKVMIKYQVIFVNAPAKSPSKPAPKPGKKPAPPPPSKHTKKPSTPAKPTKAPTKPKPAEPETPAEEEPEPETPAKEEPEPETPAEEKPEPETPAEEGPGTPGGKGGDTKEPAAEEEPGKPDGQGGDEDGAYYKRYRHRRF
ncbi:hypothetical protein TWF718_003548 [Orbilia javanica]|uniref:Uncharacterized protein n=1 Tax=Orbilia javanica TaxID=47235 RepID=A0AAN8RJ40_9PEZI